MRLDKETLQREDIQEIKHDAIIIMCWFHVMTLYTLKNDEIQQNKRTSSTNLTKIVGFYNGDTTDKQVLNYTKGAKRRIPK